MIIVKSFSNIKALDYFLAFKVNNGIKSYRKEKFFVVTPQNLKELYLEKIQITTSNFLKNFISKLTFLIFYIVKIIYGI